MPSPATHRTSAGPKRSPLASLENVTFRWLYISNAAFFFAMMGQMVVRSYLAFDLTGSAFALGLINFAVAVPMLVISPFGGVMADRFERRRLIMSAQAVVLISETFVLALIVLDLIAFWHLMVMTSVLGCVFPVMMPARQAIVADIVGRRGIGNAMALQMGAMNAARVVAPAIAGFVIALAGVEGAFVVATVLYALAFGVMTKVPSSRPPARLEATGVLKDIEFGMRYVWRDVPVRVLMILGVVPLLLAMPFQSLLPVFAEDVWDVGAPGLGILHAAAGAGGLAGSVLVAVFGDTERKFRLMMASLIGFGGTLALFALSPWFLLGVGLVLIADIFASTFQTMNNTVVQVLIPDAVRGRVMSLMMMTFGLTPLGTVPIAAVAQQFGAPAAVAGACVLMLAASFTIWLVSRSFRNIDRIAAAALARDDEDSMQERPAERPKVAATAS